MIVVDANVIAYWLIQGEFTALARRLRETEPEWIVPALCRHELANVIASYVRHGAMDVEEAPRIWQTVEAMLAGSEYAVDLSAVIAIAVDKQISAYDAQYLWLSEVKNVPLVSQDKKLPGKSGNALSLQAYLDPVD
ncbi:MAG: type II toxin-antitoxin system VapC family toxin [Haliea sp.]